MDELQVSQRMGQLFRRTLRIVSRKVGYEVSAFDWQDELHRDALAREIYHDKRVNVEECFPLMKNLVQTSPGGLLALAWLGRYDQIEADTLINVVCNLEIGEPMDSALDEKDSVEVFESLSKNLQLTKENRCLVSFYLLSSSCISDKGRLDSLKRMMALPAFSLPERRIIIQWAMGLDVEQELPKCDIPDVPPALARIAVVIMVDSGIQVIELVRHIILHIEEWEQKCYVLNGVLDIVEKGFELQASLRTSVFNVCLEYGDPALRRRTYRIIANTDNKELLSKATKDKDPNVRRWAIGLLKNS